MPAGFWFGFGIGVTVCTFIASVSVVLFWLIDRPELSWLVEDVPADLHNEWERFERPAAVPNMCRPLPPERTH